MNQGRRGFTLIELLVVIAIIAILASLLLPVLAKAKLQALGSKCMSNQKQLVVAWKMYVDDSQGRFPLNADESSQQTNGWCDGVLSWAVNNTDNTNTVTMQKGLLGPYVRGQAGIYKCPADNWDAQEGSAMLPRCRSISMNAYIGMNPLDLSSAGLGPSSTWGGAAAGYYVYEKESQVIKLTPSKLWLFLDEHADSINDGFFIFSMTRPGFDDGPGAYHDGACDFSFVDGHAEIHPWTQQLQCAWWPMVLKAKWPGNLPEGTTGPDVVWMYQHTSAHP